MLNFASAYQQLSVYEREFVDDFLRRLERENAKNHERLTVTLTRLSNAVELPLLDDRTRDLLSKPMVIAAIHATVEQLASERDLSPERVIAEHAKIAFADLSRWFPRVGEDGIPIFDATKITKADWAAVQSFEVEETYGPRGGMVRKQKLKLNPKQTSLDALSKYMGLDKGDSAQWQQYKNLPAELLQLKNSATLSEVAEQYARYLDDR